MEEHKPEQTQGRNKKFEKFPNRIVLPTTVFTAGQCRSWLKRRKYKQEQHSAKNKIKHPLLLV